MIVYSYSDARQKLAKLLEEAQGNREVLIKRKDGEWFSVKEVQPSLSPLDVPGVDTNATTEHILDAIRESRAMPDRR